MQLAFQAILILALLAGLSVLAGMGARQRRRRTMLARAAHEMGMRFFPGDPLDLLRRYSRFVLPSSGHSPRAQNVIFGRCGGWSVRVFDYHCEAGHGPQRLARNYSVIVADTDLLLPAALLWRAGEGEQAPLAVRQPAERLGAWRVLRGGDFARLLAAAFEAPADEPVALETMGGSVMVGWARRWAPREVSARLAAAAAGLRVLKDRLDIASPPPL